MSHVREHCQLPKVTRAWRKLGAGAVWICTCGQMYRLIVVPGGFAHDPYLDWQA